MARVGRRSGGEAGGDGAVRLDTWLWAARFFKTRSQAHAAVVNGRVFVDSVRAKPSKAVSVGQRMEVSTPRGRYVIDVAAVSTKRGSGASAAEMYRETEGSKVERERNRELRRAAEAAAPRKRPNTQERRLLRRVKQGDED